jgi:hypothetical protein
VFTTGSLCGRQTVVVNSSIVNKMAKARAYASTPERVSIDHLELHFHGSNQTHRVEFERGSWACDCDFFAAWRTCSHTMALEQLLSPMLTSGSEANAGLPRAELSRPGEL